MQSILQSISVGLVVGSFLVAIFGGKLKDKEDNRNCLLFAIVLALLAIATK